MRTSLGKSNGKDWRSIKVTVYLVVPTTVRSWRSNCSLLCCFFFFVKPENKQITVEPCFPAIGEQMTPSGMFLKATQVSYLSPVATSVDSRGFCAVCGALLITKLHKPSAFSATGIWALLKQSDKKRCAENLERKKCQHVAERGKFLHGVNGTSGFFFLQMSQIPKWCCTNLGPSVGPH